MFPLPYFSPDFLCLFLFPAIFLIFPPFFCHYFFPHFFQFPGGGPPGGLGLPGLPQRLDMPPVSMSLSSSRQEHLMSLASASAAAQAFLTSACFIKFYLPASLFRLDDPVSGSCFYKWTGSGSVLEETDRFWSQPEYEC
jgi:hypothetical protein